MMPLATPAANEATSFPPDGGGGFELTWQAVFVVTGMSTVMRRVVTAVMTSLTVVRRVAAMRVSTFTVMAAAVVTRVVCGW